MGDAIAGGAPATRVAKPGGERHRPLPVRLPRPLAANSPPREHLKHAFIIEDDLHNRPSSLWFNVRCFRERNKRCRGGFRRAGCGVEPRFVQCGITEPAEFQLRAGRRRLCRSAVQRFAVLGSISAGERPPSSNDRALSRKRRTLKFSRGSVTLSSDTASIFGGGSFHTR
jgi:hypothetical protein